MCKERKGNRQRIVIKEKKGWKNGIIGDSLLDLFEAEKDIQVPNISDSIEVEIATKKAFEHLMKTKIGADEKIPENILEQIKDIISLPKYGQNIGIPIYDQVHQANVCVICDRFITGIAEMKWIKKNTLLQYKSRLSIPGLKKELQQCYQVSDPELHVMLLSPRARFKNSGEYLCCHQCERALQNDRLDKNPPKYAISNNFAIGALPDQFSIGQNVIYDQNENALWTLINRVVILNFKNHCFATDPAWGERLKRIHLGKTKQEDVDKINTRVVGPNLS